MAGQTPVGARSNRRRETVLLGKHAAGWLLEGAGDSAPRGMIVQIERSDRTRLIGQRTSDNSAPSGLLNSPSNTQRVCASNEPNIFVRHLGVTVLFVVLHGVLGCATARPIRSPSETASIVSKDSSGLFILPRFIVHEETARYSVHSITRTDEITPTPGTRDSIVFTEILLVAVRQIENGLYQLTISSEPSPPPAQTSAANLPREHKLLEATVDSANGTFTMPHVSQPTVCDTATTLLSPLLLRALLSNAIVNGNSTSLGTPEVFAYTTCRAGLNILHTVNWFAPRMKTAMMPSTIQATFSGRVTADSSVSFAMNLTGLVSGNTKVVPDTGTTLLPRRIHVYTITQLHATNNMKQQHFQQETQTVITKR